MRTSNTRSDCRPSTRNKTPTVSASLIPKRRAHTESGVPIIGWREYLAFPDWGIFHILAKIDTGAKSTAIDIDDDNLDCLPGGRVAFHVVLDKKRQVRRRVVAPVSRRKRVRSSNGLIEERVFVTTTLLLGGVEKPIEVSLVRRHHMLCRALLGRSAIGRDFVIEPWRRFVQGK